MKIVVTGAAGFLGTRLIEALLAGAANLRAFDSIAAVDLTPCRVSDPRVEPRTGSVADAGFVRSLIDREVGVVFHLAAVLSGQSEADFDLGMAINVDATRGLLEACRRSGRSPRFVFASSVAVFGGPLPPVVPENFALFPQSSYGSAKAVAELLVADYSRRGFVDGISCRLPTVAIRPGKPNSALSSFVSGIVREPLAGLEARLPVPLDTRLWITSPDTVTANLLHAAVVSASALGERRSVTLPGLSVTAAEMLDSLERQAGADTRARVRCEEDPEMMRIVCTWPGAFDVSRALALGFRQDRDVDSLIAEFRSDRHNPELRTQN